MFATIDNAYPSVRHYLYVFCFVIKCQLYYVSYTECLAKLILVPSYPGIVSSFNQSFAFALGLIVALSYRQIKFLHGFPVLIFG